MILAFFMAICISRICESVLKKVYISANELLSDSFSLAKQVYESGFRPSLIVGVWRGGAPVAIAVQEYFEYLGHATDHIAIRASSYKGLHQQEGEVQVEGLGALSARIGGEDQVLLIDDVFDSGRSMEAILSQLEVHAEGASPTIKIACPWYKPNKNLTSIKPHHYLHTTDEWLVFPHELVGLSQEEIRDNKADLKAVDLEYSFEKGEKL